MGGSAAHPRLCKTAASSTVTAGPLRLDARRSPNQQPSHKNQNENCCWPAEHDAVEAIVILEAVEDGQPQALLIEAPQRLQVVARTGDAKDRGIGHGGRMPGVAGGGKSVGRGARSRHGLAAMVPMPTN